MPQKFVANAQKNRWWRPLQFYFFLNNILRKTGRTPEEPMGRTPSIFRNKKGILPLVTCHAMVGCEKTTTPPFSETHVQPPLFSLCLTLSSPHRHTHTHMAMKERASEIERGDHGRERESCRMRKRPVVEEKKKKIRRRRRRRRRRNYRGFWPWVFGEVKIQEFSCNSCSTYRIGSLKAC
jgi:hypothetical protein